MKRREFVRNMALASAGTPIIVNKMKLQSIGKQLFEVSKAAEDRVLVIIRLNGGNDGLTTIIPRDQYSNLTIQRNNVLVPEASILPLTAEVGMHPVMGGMQNMFNNGKLGIIQNVGYPEQNRSHFRSMDIWSSGLIDAAPNRGWIGRAFDDLYPNYPDAYPNATYPDPFAISMGYELSSTCQGLMANFSHAVNNPFDNYNLTSANATNDGTYYGDNIEYLSTLIDQANQYGAQIEASANNGNTLSSMYDDNNPLAVQLRYVAQMISGGLQTKVYVLNVNGFDTHANQVTQGDPTTGVQADLLKKVSDAVAAFQDDLNLLGLENRVAGMTFSEFGRQIASNASYGTDHGDAAPLILFGTCLGTTIHGPNPTIGNTIVNQAAVPMQVDFRDVYASILRNWFLIDETSVQSLFEHSVTYYNFLGSCNLGLDDKHLAKEKALVYPNPASKYATVQFTCENERVAVRIIDTNGRVIQEVTDQNLSQGQHDIKMELNDLQSGSYFVDIRKESGVSQVHFTVVK